MRQKDIFTLKRVNLTQNCLTLSKQELRCSFLLTVIFCPDFSRFSQLCKSTSTPQLYTPSSFSQTGTGSPDAVQTVEGDSTSASALSSSPLPVDPVRENENEGESNLESYAVFFSSFFLKTVGCLRFFRYVMVM